MPQINCPSCKHQFFADSPGAFVTSAGFAIAGAIICRLCFGHFIVNDTLGPMDIDEGVHRFKAPPADGNPVRGVGYLLISVLGFWGFIGGFAGCFVGMAVDHFSRRCPKCGHKQ
jgi:hypothetical protein